MALQIGDTAPDFEAETTEGKIHFHDWIGNSWVVLFSHPKDFTPVCTTELGTMARLKPEFDKRGVKIIGLSVDPVTNHTKWAQDIKDVVGFAPNYPMIGDTDLHISKLYGMLPAATAGTSEGRTPADNQTVRNVFIVGPDKKIKLVLVYPMTTGRNFDEVLRVGRLAATDRQAPGGDAGQLEARRGRHPHRRRDQRRSQEALSGGLERAEALYPHRAAAALTHIRLWWNARARLRPRSSVSISSLRVNGAGRSGRPDDRLRKANQWAGKDWIASSLSLLAMTSGVGQARPYDTAAAFLFVIASGAKQSSGSRGAGLLRRCRSSQ